MFCLFFVDTDSLLSFLLFLIISSISILVLICFFNSGLISFFFFSFITSLLFLFVLLILNIWFSFLSLETFT
ncbi:hypothetical protein U3516DRAFT_915156, partial [Neocallimastix sp. 'constans']